MGQYHSRMNAVTGVLAVVTLAAIVYKLYTGGKRPNAPGPQPLPVIGNVHELDRRSIHFSLFNWYLQYGSVFQFRILWRPYVVISSPEAIHEALVQKSADFASRPYIYRAQIVNAGQQDIGTQPYTPLLRTMKKEAQRALKAYGTGLERIESITLSSVEELVEMLQTMEGKEAVDLKPELYRTIINTLCVLIFGRKVSREDPLVDRVIELDQQVASSFTNKPSGLLMDVAPWSRFIGNSQMWNTLKTTVEVSNKFWNDFVLPHKGEWEADPDRERGVADSLFAAQRNTVDENGNSVISDDNVRLSLQNLIVAGSVTTTNSLYAFLNIMLHYPHAQAKIQQEVDSVVGSRPVTLADKANMHYTRAALLELLRYVTVNPMAIPHVTTVDTSVEGHFIPKDTVCLMNLWAAHHDKCYWPEPYVFKPERFLDKAGKLVSPDHPSRKRLFAFGAGARVCMGETLALNRLFLIIATLLQKFDFLPSDKEPRVSCDPRDYTFTVLLTPLPYRVRIQQRSE